MIKNSLEFVKVMIKTANNNLKMKRKNGSGMNFNIYSQQMGNNHLINIQIVIQQSKLFSVFLSWQVMNCLLPETQQAIWSEQEDIFIIINPKGKVIKADRSNFKIDERQKESDVFFFIILQLFCQSDKGSIYSFESNSQLYNIQKNHGQQFEKQIEKDLKKAASQMYQVERKSQQFDIVQETDKLKERLDKLDLTIAASTNINKDLFKEIRSFFQSEDLLQFLETKCVGESFQFELEKWGIFRIYNEQNFTQTQQTQTFRQITTLYTKPSSYPTSSYLKHHCIPQIMKFLNDAIPLTWKTPSISQYVFPRQYTINKASMMEDLMEQLKTLEMNKLELYLEKERKFEWKKDIWQDPLINYFSNSITIPSQVEITEKQKQNLRWQLNFHPGIQYFSRVVRIDNIPVNQEAYKKYDGMIKYALEAEIAKENPESQSVAFQGLDPISFQLLTSFYSVGISTEVNLNSKFVPFPQCYKVNLLEKKDKQQINPNSEFQFQEGKPTLIYLINWDVAESVKKLEKAYLQMKEFMDGDCQALSGVQKNELALRLILFNSTCQIPLELIKEHLVDIFDPNILENQVEIWEPISDFYLGNQEYIYLGLLHKFFGLDIEQDMMLLYGRSGLLKWRGGVEDMSLRLQLLEVLSSDEEQVEVQTDNQSETFFSRIREINNDDNQWIALKKYFRNPKTKEQLKEIFERLDSQVSDDNWFRIESTKFKLWNNQKRKFIDFISKPKLSYQLDDLSNQLMQVVIEEVNKII